MKILRHAKFILPFLLGNIFNCALCAQRTHNVFGYLFGAKEPSLRHGFGNLMQPQESPAPGVARHHSWYDSLTEEAALSLASFQNFWPTHVFGNPQVRNVSAGFFDEHDATDWVVLVAVTVMMVLVDAIVIQPRIKPTSGFSGPGLALCFWLGLGLCFNLYIGFRHGVDDGMKWCNGYLLEWLLSMDNLFVFHLVFHLYKTPAHLLHKALFWGILGAILFRLLFFIALNSLLHVMHWFRYVFGFFLVVSGIQAARDDDEDPDLENSGQVKWLRWLFKDRLMKDPSYEMNGKLFIWKSESQEENALSAMDTAGTANSNSNKARLQISMLVPVIICLELTDIFFAVDSVSAKVAQIPDQYVAYSSSVFAMFGLRSLFFIVENLINRLHLLKYGLCFILVFIGAELLLSDYVRMPATAVCLLLISVFGLCVVLSLIFPQKQEADSRT